MSLALPLDQNPGFGSLNDSITIDGVVDPFIYKTGRYIFKLAARPTTHRLLEQSTLSRLDDNLNGRIAKALQNGASPVDPVPNNFIYVRDDFSGAYIAIEGNKQAPVSPYQLRWADLRNLEHALTLYLQNWSRVKRSSLVDIWIYNPTQLLLAKGSAERGWPFEPAPNSSSDESMVL